MTDQVTDNEQKHEAMSFSERIAQDRKRLGYGPSVGSNVFDYDDLLRLFEDMSNNTISRNLHESRMSNIEMQLAKAHADLDNQKELFRLQLNRSQNLADQAKIMAEALEFWLACEDKKIKENGPYIGGDINECLSKARASLAKYRDK